MDPDALPSAEYGLVLRLYVAGSSPNSRAALANLQNLLRSAERRRAHLEVIDVFREPERGLRDGILITPTLVRLAPSPAVRIVGNLSDFDALRLALELLGG